MKSFFLSKSILKKLISNKQVNIFILCLLLSCALWISITYSKEYIYSETFPISFIDNSNKVDFFTKDSVITIEVKTNGFEYLANQLFVSHKKKIVLDINDINLNLAKGKSRIPVSRLKPMIMKQLGTVSNNTKVSPENIHLVWNKVYSKKVPVILCANFSFLKPYDAYKKPEMLIKEVIVEGNKEELDKLDTLYTKKIEFKNISRTTTLSVPIDMSLIKPTLVCKTTNIPVKIVAEKYTENIINIPIDVIRYEDYQNIKLLPREVKVRYRVAMKDYNKANVKDFKSYVICSHEALSNDSKLKVYLSNIPDYIKVVSVIPEKVEYILFK